MFVGSKVGGRGLLGGQERYERIIEVIVKMQKKSRWGGVRVGVNKELKLL